MTGAPGGPDATGKATGKATVPAQQGGDAEVAQLRAQVSGLEAELSAARAEPSPPRPAGARGGWWRTPLVAVLITIAALLAPLSIVAIWAHDQVSDTDRYLQTVSPLASDPAVQNAIINRVTGEIVSRIDVNALTSSALDALEERGLPPNIATSLKALSTPLANAVASFIHDRVARIVRSPQFEQAWIQANREAHTQMVAVLTGKDTDTVTVSSGAVTISLAAIIDTVKAQLVASGFELAGRIPEVDAQFTVLQSADLEKAQRGFRLLSAVARWLPVLALLLIGLAVFIARSRRRALLAAALAIAGSMLLLGITLNVFRAVYLDAVPPDQLPHNAAATIYDTLVEFMRLNLRAVLVVGLAVALGAWLTGGSGAAVATRRGIVGGVAYVRGGAEHVGLRTGPVGAFCYRYRVALRALVLGVAVLVYVAEAHPTGAFSLKVLAVTAVLLLVVEFLARPPTEDAAASPPAGAAPA